MVSASWPASLPAPTSETSMPRELPGGVYSGRTRAGTSMKTPIAMQPERRLVKVWLNADALWVLLRKMDISQNDLARRAGITGPYLSQLMNRKRNPSFQTVQRLLAALGGVTFHDIFVVEYADEG